MPTYRKNLGLAVTEQGITAVEVGTSKKGRTLLHAAALPFTKELSLEAAERLGQELKQVLRRNGFTASRCVIGLAASWIAGREKRLPATDAGSLQGILSIAAEREFASGSQELSFDYCLGKSATGTSALLAAAPRRIVDQLAVMAKAAGLSVVALTASAAATAMATEGASAPGEQLVLCLLPGGVELAARTAGGVRMIRHLPVRLDRPETPVGALSGELRRIMALSPARPEPGQAPELLVWDAIGWQGSSLEAVAAELKSSLRVCEVEADLRMAGASVAPASGKFAQAAALACDIDGPPAIDFLHSRLAPARKSRVGKRSRWAIAAAVALLALTTWFFLDWGATRSQMDATHRRLEESGRTLKDASELIDRVSFARTWYDRRPAFLDCLRQITRSFPDEGTVWVTSLMVRENMEASLAGKAISKTAVLELLVRLQADPRLADVKPQYIRQVSDTSNDVSFSISLNLRGAR